MADRLSFDVEWQALASGAPEERSTFADIGIRWNDVWLTEAENAFINRVVQSKVPLSSYRLAEWIVWNWWRLRWEPRRNSSNWSLAHRMTSIGGGYVWPNITIDSDGERIVVDAQPTQPKTAEPLRYIIQRTVVVAATEFEAATNDFLERVSAKLLSDKIAGSNLQVLWTELLAEKADPKASERRKLEALLGFDPDEAPERVLENLVQDFTALGEDSVQELAADYEQKVPPTAVQIDAWSRDNGSEWKPRDMVKLGDRSIRALPTREAAWKRGSAAAQALRDEQNLGPKPVSSKKLCELLGTQIATVTDTGKSAPLNFALMSSANAGLVALKSRYETGRRFNLARLLGDKIAVAVPGRLVPATNAATYRQRVQRSFAAEFLCPFDALMDRLQGSVDEDSVAEAADYFDVSAMAVQNILANHRVIDRDEARAGA